MLKLFLYLTDLIYLERLNTLTYMPSPFGNHVDGADLKYTDFFNIMIFLNKNMVLFWTSSIAVLIDKS